jgi:hypothetical protein
MPKKPAPPVALIPVERIEQRIYLIRGHKVMLDNELAALYQASTKALNQAVKRNRNRFPKRFHVPSHETGSGIFEVTNCDLKNGTRRASV